MVPPTGKEVDPSADLDYIDGIRCLQQNGGWGCRMHFDNAIAKDRWFNRARQLRISLIDQRLQNVGRQRFKTQDCAQDLIVTLILDVKALTDGVATAAQLVDIARTLTDELGGNVQRYFLVPLTRITPEAQEDWLAKFLKKFV